MGNIKVASRGDVIDLISFKKVTPECRCTTCGQIFESRPHIRRHAVLSFLMSIVIMFFTVPMAFIFGSLIHISVGIIVAFLAMWASLVLPIVLTPSYKPISRKKTNQKLSPTRKASGESGNIYSRTGQL